VIRTEFLTDSADMNQVNPRLRELLEKDELDWDHLPHREMYLRSWVVGSIPRFYREDGVNE
jgi:hypothetical protein